MSYINGVRKINDEITEAKREEKWDRETLRKIDFEVIRKQRRSFEEKLRKDLLELENDGKMKESEMLLYYLDKYLYEKIAELKK